MKKNIRMIALTVVLAIASFFGIAVYGMCTYNFKLLYVLVGLLCVGSLVAIYNYIVVTLEEANNDKT